jgi:hypothetical protein
MVRTRKVGKLKVNQVISYVLLLFATGLLIAAEKFREMRILRMKLPRGMRDF